MNAAAVSVKTAGRKLLGFAGVITPGGFTAAKKFHKFDGWYHTLAVVNAAPLRCFSAGPLFCMMWERGCLVYAE